MRGDRLPLRARPGRLRPALTLLAGATAFAAQAHAQSSQADASGDTRNEDGASEAYVDRLISDGALPEDISADESGAINRKGNLRSLVVELGGSHIRPRARVEGNDTSAFDTVQEELGLTVSGRYQTVNYGLLGMDAQLRTGTAARAFDASDSSAFNGALTLSSTGLPLGNGWVADSYLGNVTSQSIDLLRRQQRFFIPTSPLLGASLQAHSYAPVANQVPGVDPRPVASLNLAIGEPGLLGGIRLGSFTGLSGLSMTAGGQADLAPGISVGFQGVAIEDSRDPFAVISSAQTQGGNRLSSRSALASIRMDDGALQLQANSIWSDVSGDPDPDLSVRETGKAAGVWLDATLRQGRTAHSGGVYYFDPGLAWGTAIIVNNAYGAYYRFSTSSQRWRWTASVDAVESVNGLSSSGILANVDIRRQLSFRLAAGINSTVRVANGQTASQLLGFVDLASGIGTTRLEAGWSHDPASDLYRVGWNQNWNLPAWLPSGSRLSSQLSFDHRRVLLTPTILGNSGRMERGNSLGIGISGGANPFTGVTLDATFAYRSNASRSAQSLFGPVDSTGGVLDVLAAQQDLAFSATLVATARLSSSWTLSASFSDTRSSLLSRNGLLGQPGSPLGFTPEEIARIQRSSFRLQAGTISLQHVFSAGNAQGVLGRPEYPVGGTGSLRGRVFLDANGNGVRDADERGVPDIVVILDGLQAVRTDETGSYRFEGVIDGRHTITVNADALPLPWSIVSNASDSHNGSYATTISMRVRSVTNLDIPAIRE
ncbi:MAG: SdrD B-like domain-containing protein [Blastomonas sp.]